MQIPIFGLSHGSHRSSFGIPSHHYHLSKLETREETRFVDKYESGGKVQIRQDNDEKTRGFCSSVGFSLGWNSWGRILGKQFLIKISARRINAKFHSMASDFTKIPSFKKKIKRNEFEK